MDWAAWRREFPVTERCTHLNHAGVSPVSRRVTAAVHAVVDEALVGDAATQGRWAARGEAVRAGFARLVGARADEIAFVTNTSEGISLIAAGLDWRAGDNVVGVDGEYPSNVYPWFNLRRWGVETRLVPPVHGAPRLADLAARVDARTRVVAVSFVDWSTGARTDLAPIGAFCRARGILFCVDGIQGVGAVPLDVEQSGIDCLAVGGHKWLLAPEGCGCLFVSRRVVGRIASVLQGWKSVDDPDTYLPYHFEPRADAAKFEPGTPPLLGIHALGAAIDLLLEIGVENVWKRVVEITDRLAAGLRARGAELLGPWGDSQRSGIVVFRTGVDPHRLAADLGRKRFVVRVRGGGIRVAPHFYTDEGDIDRFLAALDAG